LIRFDEKGEEEEQERNKLAHRGPIEKRSKKGTKHFGFATIRTT
jgi:hypothetical protein